MQRQNQNFVDINLSKFFAFLEAENRLKSSKPRAGQIYEDYRAFKKPTFLTQNTSVLILVKKTTIKTNRYWHHLRFM